MAGLDPAIHAFPILTVEERGCPAHRRAEATPSFGRLWPGMTIWSTHIPQHRFDRLALVGGQRCLRRDGIADVIALDRKPRLDAGGEIVAREGFVDPPQPSLQHQRVVPALRFAEIVELDALARDNAGRPR